MSALGRAEGVGTRSWRWACQGACAQGPIGSTSKKASLGTQGQQERRQIQQQEDPLGELSCTHLKLFSRTVSHNGEHGGNFSGPPPALPHTRSPVGRGSGSVVMNQGWSHGGHFRKLHFYFYNSLKQTCFIFKHHSLCTTEYNLKVPEGSGQTWGPRRDS